MILLGIIMIFLPQGQDALHSVFVEGQKWPYFLMATILTAIQCWYWTRFTYDGYRHSHSRRGYVAARRERHRRTDQGKTDPLTEWVPRILGFLLFVETAIAVWRAGSCPWALLLLLCGVLFLAFTFLRRRFLSRRTSKFWAPEAKPLLPVKFFSPSPAHLGAWILILWLAGLLVSAVSTLFPAWEFAEGRQALGAVLAILVFLASFVMAVMLPLPRTTHWAVIALLLLCAPLAAVGLYWPHYSACLGPGVVLLWAAANWIGVVNFLIVYPSEMLGLPVGGTMLLASLLFFALPDRGGNHAIRMTKAPDPALSVAQSPKDLLRTAFDAWWEQAPAATNGGKVMILVAAQGGASRAALWTSIVLGGLEDSDPEFHKRIFAMSGASGGSLGLALYHSLLRQPGKPLCQEPGSVETKHYYARCGQLIARQDFLSPIFVRLFQSDILGDLMPGALYGDRAEALEQSWERAWNRVVKSGGPKMSDEFALRLPGAKQDWLPILILNGTSVTSGHRIITSDLPLASCEKNAQSDILLDAVDFFCVSKSRIRISTAVHNSARFPYFSPAGTVIGPTADNNKIEPLDRIVDGGYFDNLGGDALMDLIPKLIGLAGQRQLQIVVLALDNDPGAEEAAAKLISDEQEEMSGIDNFLPELLSPVVGVVHVRDGHGSYAREQLKNRLPPDVRYVSFEVTEEGDWEPAMSWVLSGKSQASLVEDYCGPTGDGSRTALTTATGIAFPSPPSCSHLKP